MKSRMRNRMQLKEPGHWPHQADTPWDWSWVVTVVKGSAVNSVLG